MALLVSIAPLISGSRVTLRACSVQDRAFTSLGGNRWWPAIPDSGLPSLGIQLFEGNFGDSISPGSASVGLLIDKLEKLNASVRGANWAGAAVTIYHGTDPAAWPWATLFTGKVKRFEINDEVIKLTAEVNDAPFDADALTATYAGTTGAEGAAEMKGKVKPWVFGKAKNVEPVLIDVVENVFQFSAYGQIKAVDTLYERGSAFPASSGNYATYAALVAASIGEGAWATCLAAGMIRLGAPAYGVITGDIQGDAPGGTLLEKTGAIIDRVCTQAGISAGLIDSASLTALDVAVPYPINLVLNNQETIISLAQRLVRPCNAQAGISWTGKLFAVRVAIGTPVKTLNAQGAFLPRVSDNTESDTSPPYTRIEMTGDKAWRVHSLDEIASDVNLIDRGTYVGPTVYREGNIVSLADGSRYLYINAAPTSGNTPPNATYWSLLNSATAATWSAITGAGKPADDATVGGNFGINVWTEGGPLAVDLNVVTSQGTAAAIAGQAAAATDATIEAGATAGATWGANIVSRPTWAIDGRAGLGFDAVGDLSRNLTTARANSSALLRFASGGLFTGELAADLTSAHVAASITGQGALATQGTVKTTQIPKTRIGSLIPGEQFETEAHWTFVGGGSFVTSDALLTLANTLDLKLMKSAVGNGTTSQAISRGQIDSSLKSLPVRVGESIQFSNRFIYASGFTGLAQILVVFYDDALAQVGVFSFPGTDYRTTAKVGAGYQDVTGSAIVPAGAMTMQVRPFYLEWSTTLLNAGYLLAEQPYVTRRPLWAQDIAQRPAELTDGRIAAGLDSAGDLARNVTSGRRNSSNLLGYSGGALYVGELTADLTSSHTAAAIAGQAAAATDATIEAGATAGATWGTNVGSRPAELTDGRIAAGLTVSGNLALDLTITRANSSGLLRYASGGLFTGELAADLTSAHVAASITGQAAAATDATIEPGATKGADFSGVGQASLWPNARFKLLDATDRPAGCFAGYSNSDPTSITLSPVTDGGVRLDTGPGDLFRGIYFEAIRVFDNNSLQIDLRLIVETAAANGLYIRVVEYSGDLPSGKKFISDSGNTANESGYVSGTIKTLGYDDIAVPAAETDYSIPYTPTAGTKWFSLHVRLANVVAGAWLDVRGLAIVSKADVTSSVVPSMTVPAPQKVYRDYQGTVKTGQLPRTLNCTRKKGGTDVTTSATWSVSIPSGWTLTIGAATGIITATTITTEGSAIVTSTYEGLALSQAVPFTFADDPAPSGGSYPPVTDNSILGVSTTSYVNISDVLPVVCGPSGQIALSAPLNITGTGSETIKWLYSTSASMTSPTIVGSAATSTVAATSPEFEPGYVNLNATKTGLTNGVTYYFQLQGLRATGSGTLNNSGTVSATPSA